MPPKTNATSKHFMHKDSLPVRILKSTGARTAGVIIASLLIIGFQIHADQSHIVVDRFELSLESIPKAFDGYKIVHLSDLHGVRFKDGQAGLIRKIEAEQPDLIVISGDTLDKQFDHWENSLSLIRALSQNTPVFMSTGNHEYWAGKRTNIPAELSRAGATLLQNTSIKLHPPGINRMPEGSNSCAIRLFGIDDPWFFESDEAYLNTLYQMKTKALTEDQSECFSLLISHRPELQSLYQRAGYDLTFSGHAHGGQVRLPFTEGLVAPNQGFFPKLTSGLHEKQGRYLLISRGLGNPKGFPRVFNPPEVVSLTLRHKQPE